MTQGESPAVARRRLRLALRQAREAKGFTQGQVADHLDWSLSKVQRIESGDVTVSSTDLKAFLADVGVGDSRRVSELVDLAKTSRLRRGFWEESKYRKHLTPGMTKLIQFESEASSIRGFHPTLLPGLLQTREYAEFILNYWVDELSEEERAVRLEARLRRREELLYRPDPPLYLLVLDQSVLLREVGGARIMAEQLQDLLEVMRRPKVMVRIVPFDSGAHLAMLNPFILIDLGDEENAVLYREAQLADEIEESAERTRLYRQRFERLWEASLSEDATARMVEASVARLLSGLDLARRGRD